MRYENIEMFRYPDRAPENDSLNMVAHESFPRLGFEKAYFLEGQFWCNDPFEDAWPMSVTHWLPHPSYVKIYDSKNEWNDPKVLLPAKGERVIAKNDYCEAVSWIDGFNELGKPAWCHEKWEHADDFVTGWKRITK